MMTSEKISNYEMMSKISQYEELIIYQEYQKDLLPILFDKIYERNHKVLARPSV